jgi:cytochrome c biogenesis protein CcmG, thiol:disulfide interchange protein DsbE
MLLLSLVALAAGCLILVLLTSAVYTQRNPGGILSSIRVGAPAPDFDLPTADGGSVHLSTLRGRPVMVTFWATWCPGCAEELPVLAEAEKRHADAGLAVVVVNPGQRSEHILGFLRVHGVSLPVARDVDRKVWRLYDIVALPTTVWIDRDGIVRAAEIGEVTQAGIDRHVRDLDGGTPTAAAP